MVTQQKALTASAIAAAIVGATHWFAHEFFGTGPEAVIQVGFTVVAVTFAVAYWGMRNN